MAFHGRLHPSGHVGAQACGSVPVHASLTPSSSALAPPLTSTQSMFLSSTLVPMPTGKRKRLSIPPRPPLLDTSGVYIASTYARFSSRHFPAIHPPSIVKGTGELRRVEDPMVRR